MCPNFTMRNEDKANTQQSQAGVWTSFGVCTGVQFQLDRLCLNIARGQENKLLMINAFVQDNKLSHKLTLIEAVVLCFLKWN